MTLFLSNSAGAAKVATMNGDLIYADGNRIVRLNMLTHVSKTLWSGDHDQRAENITLVSDRELLFDLHTSLFSRRPCHCVRYVPTVILSLDLRSRATHVMFHGRHPLAVEGEGILYYGGLNDGDAPGSLLYSSLKESQPIKTSDDTFGYPYFIALAPQHRAVVEPDGEQLFELDLQNWSLRKLPIAGCDPGPWIDSDNGFLCIGANSLISLVDLEGHSRRLKFLDGSVPLTYIPELNSLIIEEPDGNDGFDMVLVNMSDQKISFILNFGGAGPGGLVWLAH